MEQPGNQFGQWLNATMQSRGLSQADLAREVGVADAQVSRWRRGQVTPSLRYLQRLADTLGVPRASLDAMAGYPVAQTGAEAGGLPADPERDAEIQAYQARLRELLEQRIPSSLWRAYVEACEALADDLSASFGKALGKVEDEARRSEREDVVEKRIDRSIGFQTKGQLAEDEGA